MRSPMIPVLAIIAIAATNVAACQNKNPQNTPTTPSPTEQMRQGAGQFVQGAKAAGTYLANAATSAGASAKQTLGDSAITAKVKAALAANAGLKTLTLHVATENGIVTLSGTVHAESRKDLAASVAARISGVTRVINKIQVRPPHNAG